MKAKILIINIIFILIVLFNSCIKYSPDYVYKWKLAIVYNNGDKDTVNCEIESYKGNLAYIDLYMNRKEIGNINATSVPACIVMDCGWKSKIVACSVRKFTVLTFEKLIINKKI